MDICFEGIGQVVATFRVKNGEDLRPGMAVTLTGNGEVGLGEGGRPLCGVTVGAARGGAVAVQVGGVVKVKRSGTEPAVGWAALACDDEGGVKTGDDEAKFLVLAADEESVIVRL